MKEKYEDMACDIVEFEASDIIVTSGGSSNVGGFDMEVPNDKTRY